jgi:AcrR family transcriptional regulator
MAPRVTDDAILDAAMAAVVTHGYTGATTRQIAIAAGINEVTLFRRFENKQSLVLAAIHRDLAQLTSPGLHPTGNLQADLLGVLEYYTQIYRHHASLPLVIILEATRNPELANLIKEPLAAQLALRDLIAAYQRAGELRDEPPEQAVNALIGPLLAYAVDSQLGIASPTGPPPAPELLDRFLTGHRTSRETAASSTATAEFGPAARALSPGVA